MMKPNIIFALILVPFLFFPKLNAQAEGEKGLSIGGDLRTDQRFLLHDPYDWAWNETRLSLNLDKSISGNSRFHAELWTRNLGLPGVYNSSDLYNKGISDPFSMELREAWIEVYGLFNENLDLKVGRQHIAWGTADKLNPTSNLCPYDIEDILDFGRQRATNALNLNYFVGDAFSLQAVFIPLFRPANLPVGLFSNVLNPDLELPPGMVLKSFSDSIVLPATNLTDNASAGFRVKRFAKGIDLSLSYVWGMDGLPFNNLNVFTPVDAMGGMAVAAQLGFERFHIFGADLAADIAGAGVWAEAALFKPAGDVTMTNDLTALYPGSPVPVLVDSMLLKKDEPYLKFIVGGDYFFPSGGYLNLQYMHGFFHERGRKSLNDYLFMQFEQKLFRERLTIAPLSGGFVVADWKNASDNYALIYKPEIIYQATPNTTLTLSAVIFEGKGQNLFASLNDFDMLIVKMKYSF